MKLATELHAQLEAWYDQHLNSIRRVREPLADYLLEKNPAAGMRIKLDGDEKGFTECSETNVAFWCTKTLENTAVFEKMLRHYLLKSQ